MRKLYVAVLCATFVISLSQARDPESMNTAFSDIANRYLEAMLQSSPVAATGLGDHRYDSFLDQVGAAARGAKVDSARQFIRDLDSIAFDELNREHQVDYSLLRQRLRKEIWDMEELREWEWNPLIYSGLPGNSLYVLMARDTTPLKERLAHAAARCREFPRFFVQARESLVPALCPHIHAETAVDQNKGMLTLLDALLVPELDSLDEEAGDDLREAISIARSAIEEQQQWLESTLLPSAQGNPRLSPELFHEKFAFDLFSGFTVEELRGRAEEQQRELHDRMYELSLAIWKERHQDFTPVPNPSAEEKKDLIRRCLEFAYEDAPDSDGVVEAAYHSLKLTTDFVREKNLVTLPDDPLEIILMPEFRRGVSVAYCDAPGPLEEGGKTFYAVSPPPEDWTETQVNSFLREYNHRSLHNLTVHEAMPGHYVQLLRSNATSSRLRSVLSSGTFIEGWAVYSESMMVEQGFLPDDLLMRLIVLKWNLRGVTNALLDQMIHLDGIDEAAAMKLMVEDAFQEESEAAGKYRRSLLTSVQLSTYFAGYMEVVDIVGEAKERGGDDFQLKTFHDRLMSFGSPPPVFVKALLFDEPIAAP